MSNPGGGSPIGAPMSRPTLSPSVERYLTDTFARIDRMLAHLRFVEPHACELALPLEPVIETIAGHATARVLGAAVQGVRHVFGADTAAQFEQTAAAALRPDARATIVLQAVTPHAEDSAGVRRRLRARMKSVAAELRGVLASAERVLYDHDPRVLAYVFDTLADDMIIARLYIDQVLATWRAHVSALGGRAAGRPTVVLRASARAISS